MLTAHTVAIIGRVMLAALFVLAGLVKIAGPKPVLDHMRQEHVPVLLFPAVIAFEIGAGLAVAIGWQVPYAAGALAAFCVAAAIIFHRNFAERVERTMFMKDLALAGALAFVAAQAV